MTSTPNIAFVTMVRDDQFFLRLWVEYYARHVPRNHLFILLDGFDQIPPDFTAGCQIITLPRSDPGPGWDMRRWTMLADFNATLLGRFDVVVMNDVDEIIIPDPASGISLLEAVGRAREVGVITPFAVEVVHRFDLCPERLDLTRPILRQRPHVRLNSTYAKPCITSVPVRWNQGGHRSDFPKLHLDPALFLFHLHFIDRDMLVARQATRIAIMLGAASDKPDVAGPSWSVSAEESVAFLQLLQKLGEPVDNNYEFGWQRNRMILGWQQDKNHGEWKHGRIHNRHRTYVVPERFLDSF